jgi:hypothetical protein
MHAQKTHLLRALQPPHNLLPVKKTNHVVHAKALKMRAEEYDT